MSGADQAKAADYRELRHDWPALERELDLPAPLRPYQWEGVSFLYRSRAALLADEMGLGKTVEASVALALALKNPGVDRALVVAPASLVLNWQRELDRWAPSLVVRRVMGDDGDRAAFYQLPIQVLVASYEQVRADAVERIPADAFDIVILDEAQRIKNRESRTALACRLLPRHRAWALSATPLENSRDDLESVFGFLAPGLMKPLMPRDEIFAKIGPHFLRRRKADVLGDLPPVIIQDMVLDLTADQREAYDVAWASRTETLSGDPRPVSTAVLFGLITRLKQICNFEPESGKSAKLEALETLLEGISDDSGKVLVFSQYVETLKWLAEKVGDVPHEIYHGGLSQERRDEVVRQFEDEPGPRILLVSLRAGGLGLNLQAADLVVVFDRWWNPAVEIQAIHRAHRFGRKTPLHVVRFLVADTVEERINSILEAKQALFDHYVEQAPGAEVSPLTRAELLRALDLRPSEVN